MNSRILCIEDNQEMRQLLVEALVARGFAVDEATDGASGLEAIRNHVPDLVLCDIAMPGMSGFDVLQQVANTENPAVNAIPFIFLTALEDRDSVLRGRRLGADDYITKPVDFDILAEVIRRRIGPTERKLDARAALTARELEVLTWVARGKSSTDIGSLIGIAERTVDFHVENAIRKLGVATRVQAAVQAVRAKLIRL